MKLPRPLVTERLRHRGLADVGGQSEDPLTETSLQKTRVTPGRTKWTGEMATRRPENRAERPQARRSKATAHHANRRGRSVRGCSPEARSSDGAPFSRRRGATCRPPFSPL